MDVHMKALQHAKRICNKTALLGIMLNEEKISTNDKEFGHIDAIKPMQTVRESLVPTPKGMDS